MKAHKTLAMLTAVSVPLFMSAATLGGTPGASSISSSLFCEDRLQPSPKSVFLGNRDRDLSIASPWRLWNTDDLFADDEQDPYSAFFSDCDLALDHVDFVAFSGGNAVKGDPPAFGSGPAGTKVPQFAFLRGAGNNNAPVAQASLNSGGGSSAGGGGGGGNNNNNANSNSADNSGSPAQPTSPPSNTELPAPTLESWNIIPVTVVPEVSSTPSGEGSGVATLPLPAPLWMALAGLTLVVAFRRRFLP